jgi:hypothetical protein
MVGGITLADVASLSPEAIARINENRCDFLTRQAQESFPAKIATSFS